MAASNSVCLSGRTQPQHSGRIESDARSGHSLAAARLLKMGQACREFGCSPCQLRYWIRRGDVEAVRIGAAGKFRVVRSSLVAWLGLDCIPSENEKENVSGGVAVYGRRSSPTRTDREALDRQIEDLLLHCEGKLGVNRESVRVFREQASGMCIDFTARKALGQVYEAAKKGEVTTLVVRDKSRLARLPGGEALIVRILNDCGCRVVFVADFMDECEEDNKSDMEMLLNFMTVLTNRHSSKKAAYNREIHLSAEATKFILDKHRAGVSLKGLIALCKEKNVRGTKNNGVSVPLSETIIYKAIRAERKMVSVGAVKETTTPLQAWFKQRVRKAGADSWVYASELQADYEKESGQRISSKTFGMFLAACGLTAKMKHRNGVNGRAWYGIALKG